eukprot:g4408.t1
MPAKSPCRSHSFVVQHSLPRGLDSLRLSICRILYELSSPALGTIFHISRPFYKHRASRSHKCKCLLPSGVFRPNFDETSPVRSRNCQTRHDRRSVVGFLPGTLIPRPSVGLEPVLDEEKQLRWAVEGSIRAAQQLVAARSGQKREDVTEVGVSTQAGVQRESREARAAKFAKCYDRLLSVRKPGQESQNVASAEAARSVGGQNYVTSVEALPVSNGGAEDSRNVASAEVVANGAAQNNNVTSVEALPVSNAGAQDSRNVASAEVVGNGGAQINSNEASRRRAYHWRPGIFISRAQPLLIINLINFHVGGVSLAK